LDKDLDVTCPSCEVEFEINVSFNKEIQKERQRLIRKIGEAFYQGEELCLKYSQWKLIVEQELEPTLKAININTKEKFEWVIREMGVRINCTNQRLRNVRG